MQQKELLISFCVVSELYSCKTGFAAFFFGLFVVEGGDCRRGGDLQKFILVTRNLCLCTQLWSVLPAVTAAIDESTNERKL